MNRCIVFIRIEWLCPSSWSYFIQRFTLCGFKCHLLSLPNGPNNVGKNNLPQQYSETGNAFNLEGAVEFFSRAIDEYPSPPILIGHCMGGLIVQVLLSRGLGSLGIAISPIPTSPLLRRWRALRRHSQRKRVKLSLRKVRALSLRKSVTQVLFTDDCRAPLLLISGGRDQLAPPFVVKHTFRRYRVSAADTYYQNFPRSTHDLISEKEGEEVADFIIQWIHGQSFVPA